MSILNFRRFLLIFCLYVTIKTTYSKNSERPHVILIVADDVGWNDVGFHGSNQIPTPNIDALAYSGVILNRFYTAPSCTPSRAALLTGQYPARLGLQGFAIMAGENLNLPTDVPILPERLQDLGYKTHLIGKWHLGAAFKNVTPPSRGFDSYLGYWNSYISYYSHEAYGGNMSGFDMHYNDDPVYEKRGKYATDLFTERAEEIITKHNESEPLFLIMSHLAAHAGKNGRELEVPDIEENEKLFGYIADENRRRYAGIVRELDKSVGRIMALLAKEEMLENSLVIFISDNGAQSVGNYRNWGSNWPLRGIKMTVHEGGVRNLAVAYSPLFQNPTRVNNELFHITDLLPTIYAAAGGDLEDLGPLDGINQWELLTQNTGGAKRTELLVNIDELKKCSGYISDDGRYKLINGSTIVKDYDLYYGDDGQEESNPDYDINAIISSPTYVAIGKDIPTDKMLQIRKEITLKDCRKPIGPENMCTVENLCLYDLFEDPCEATNIASTSPKILERLSEKLKEAWTYLKPQKPKFVDPRANPAFCNNTWWNWLEDCPHK